MTRLRHSDQKENPFDVFVIYDSPLGPRTLANKHQPSDCNLWYHTQSEVVIQSLPSLVLQCIKAHVYLFDAAFKIQPTFPLTAFQH